MGATRVIAKDKNVILMCLWVSTWRNWSGHAEGFFKKGAFKNFANITENHLCRVFFLITIQAEGLQLYFKEAAVLVPFGKFSEIFKNTYFGNVCERLLLRVRSFTVTFRKVSGFYCVDDCFRYISFKFPESLNRAIFRIPLMCYF